MAERQPVNLKKKTARNKLDPYREPYWVRLPTAICKGGSLGFRRSPDSLVETWHGRIFIGGEYHKTNLGEVTPHFEHDEAYAAALKWAKLLKDTGPTPERSYTVEDVVDEYLLKLQGNSSTRNMDKRRQASKRLDALLPLSVLSMKVNNLEQRDLTAIQRDYSQRKNKQGRSISPDSVNRVFTHLIAALNHGHKNNLIASNKAWQHYSRLQAETEKRRAKEYISIKDREAFLKACTGPLRAFCTAMNTMAARPSEVRRLRVKDVDLKAGHVRLLTYKGSTGGSVRYFPLPEGSAVRELLNAQTAGKSADDNVFVTATDIPWTQANLAKHHNEVRDTGKFSPAFETYVWRHCRVTDWVRAGFPAPEVAALAGTSLEFIQKNYFKTDTDIRSKMAGL